MLLADVALPVPVARAFTYSIGESEAHRVKPGARVICPFGPRRMVGVVLALREGAAPNGVKTLSGVLDDLPSIPPDLLSFMVELANYYFAPIGEVLRLALPPIERSAAKAMEAPSLFKSKPRGIGTRTVQWATALERDEATGQTPPFAAGGLRGASELLMHLRAVGSTPVAKLSETWSSARSIVRTLAKKGLITIEIRPALRDPFFADPVARDSPPQLTSAQSSAIKTVGAYIGEQRSGTFLLHGVTGSGKTEVYLRAIAEARKARKGTIVLVPEIALTPQLISRFRARFGDALGVLHSGLTASERLAMWKTLRAGDVDVAIGARSALFAPLADIGLIIVDEEHDSSFKQEEGVRYHARDMAILRAHRIGAVCVLGSATPSLESVHLTRSGKATKIDLPDRARSQPMPLVDVVDLRRMGAGPTGDKRISLPLHRALETALANGEQSILFLNRRGFSPSVRCQSCGEMCSCPSCSVALTFHKRAGSLLRCHYCGYETPLLVACAKCGQNSLILEGIGTEKLEETLRAAFPDARVARLDRDVASGRSVEKVLDRMRSGDIDILVGTQMVTKGHDLPKVTLVGIINADAATSIPDFRATEHAFQLFVQVAGRAGRGEKPGRVLIQTYNPDHISVTFAKTHDVNGFIDRELTDRRELMYPPFSRVALIRIEAESENTARNACGELAEIARHASAQSGGDPTVLGPAPAPIARVRNRFRFRVMLRSVKRANLRAVLVALEGARKTLPRDVRMTLDVDPVQLL